MTPEEFAFQQALISAALVRFVTQFSKFFVNPALAIADWLGFMRLLYPEVKAARDKSAELARTFYDSQRFEAHPELPVLARDIEPYQFEWFTQAMEPVRPMFMRDQSPNTVVGQAASVAVREVENAGRKQIINAVKADKPLAEKVEYQRKTAKLTPEQVADFQALLRPDQTVKGKSWAGAEKEFTPKVVRAVTEVRGWARVATGKETCSWCLMLISRGPVYYGADLAGLDLPDEEVVQMFNKSDLNNYFDDISDYLEEWHTNCDCKVVPVFDLKDWVGLDASRKAFGLWKKASEKAAEVLDENPDKQYYSFKEKKWLPTTKNREAINQLRLMISDESSVDWAALHAA